MDEKQKKYYLEHRGIKCPFCKKIDSAVVTGHLESNGINEARQKVECNICKKTWTDIYKLVDVATEE